MKKFNVFVLCVSMHASLFGQEKDCYLLSGQYDKLPLLSLIEQVESTQTGQRVFYISEWVKDVTVSGTFQNECFVDVINKLFNSAGLYAQVIQGNIYLIKNNPVIGINQEFLSTGNTDFSGETISALLGVTDPSLIPVGNKLQLLEKGEVFLSGQVIDQNGDPIPGVNVIINSGEFITATDASGRYKIELRRGVHKVGFRFTGLSEEIRDIVLYSSGNLDIEMIDDVLTLNEVVVSSNVEAFKQASMGVERIEMSESKTIPRILGENDVIKSAMTLPGITSSGEASMGFNVRGGSADQNLILLNDLPIFNASHFFGFYSVFNEDIIGSTAIYKSYIPAQYGGRLSSVFDVRGKLPSDKLTGTMGISPISYKLSVSTPYIKNRVGATVAFRSTYSDWVLNNVDNADVKNSDPSFTDTYWSVNSRIGKKSTLEVFGYLSSDRFRLLSDTSIYYTNKIIGAIFKAPIKDQLRYCQTVGVSNYAYNLGFSDQNEGFNMAYSMQEVTVKSHLEYDGDLGLIMFGLDNKFYLIEPGQLDPRGETSTIEESRLPVERAIEIAPFVSREFSLGNNVSINTGLRYSFYGIYDPSQYYTYDGSKEIYTTSDTISVSKGFTKVYSGLEWRISASYLLNPYSSLKLSVNRTRQYMSMLSNTVSVAPFDTWKLADYHLEPQIADQVSIGYYRSLYRGMLELSVESYAKKLANVSDYKVGADLTMNNRVETDVLQGEGRTYGIETMLRKVRGKMTGWLSYTYSRSLVQMDSKHASETINNGEWYPANHDRPHNLYLTGNLWLSKRLSINANFQFTSGRPLTYPNGQYTVGETTVITYSDRNEFRLPNYFRVDLGASLEGNHRRNKLAHGYWNLSLYNLLGRNNPYSIFFVVENDRIVAKQLSIFSQIVPSISYNLKF